MNDEYESAARGSGGFEYRGNTTEEVDVEGVDVQAIVREAVKEATDHPASAGAYEAELTEERHRRETMEARLAELSEENRINREKESQCGSR